MKKRIEQLLNGIFEYEQRKLEIRPQELVFSCAPGAAAKGIFYLEPETGGKVHGFLYVSDPRMVCEPVEFQGITNEIRYQFDSSGLEPGAQKQGTITVCSECGEYAIPFTVTVDAPKQTKEQLPFADLQEFTALAEEDYQRAYRYFLSPQFRAILTKPELLALYEGLGAPDFSYQSMEEFLTGALCKEPLTLSVSREQLKLEGMTEPVRETLQLKKDGWGFQTVEVTADALFVRPERRLFTTDEFAGSTCDLHLIFDTNLMHAGNNYARLTIAAGGQTLTVEIQAKKAGGKGRNRRRLRRMQVQMEELYVNFRLQRMEQEEWIRQSVQVISEYRRAGGSDPFADLFLVQLYFAEGKKQKAMKLLEVLEAQKSRLNTPERYGFYLYVSTFFYQEASYVDRVEEEVSRLFYRDQTNWKLQWILLYLQERYLNDEDARYEAVAQQFRCGCRSRILYLEAYRILKANPFLMRRLGEFELHLLRFAASCRVLTADVVRQAAGLVQHDTAFDRRLFEVLSEGYRLYPSNEIVKAVCQILINGAKKEPEYFTWYAKGVECGLKLTGLYEAYMETMDCSDPAQMPQIIRMYFQYDTSMDYRRRAAIYRRMAENRSEDPQTYHSHRAAMEKFTLDQLERGHVTDDLAVLYRMFLRESMMNRQQAERLTRLLFTYEIRCSRPDIRQLLVRSSRMQEDAVVPVQNGQAFVRIYDQDSALIAVDAKGRRFAAGIFCSSRRLLEDENMLTWCSRKAPEYPGIVLFICSGCCADGQINRRLLPYFAAGCELGQLKEEFRIRLRQLVLSYYASHIREESLPDFLEKISYEAYLRADKASLITLLAEEGKCREAFELLDRFGAEGIPLIQLVRICSRMVLELEFEENTMLTSLCYRCFAKGKYDDKLLRYLLLYYEGPVETMKQVWSAACRFDLDTMLLEEKILTILLFTRSGTESTEPVFESYVRKMGRKKLCRAYVNLKAYEYFVRGVPVADPVFRFMEKEYVRLKKKDGLADQEEICRLALLQYYASRADGLTEQQRTITAQLLEESGAKGLRFAFWQRFDRELLKPYQMEGSVFAEYVGNPESTVTVFYRFQGEEAYRKEQIGKNFEGVYVKEFTLFEGEVLECRFEEENGGRKTATDLLVSSADPEPAQEDTMYGLLNRMARAVQAGDEKTAGELLDSCLTLSYLAKEAFTVI